MRATTQHQIRLGDRRIDYRVVLSNTARKLRIRVGPNGVEVVRPAERNGSDVAAFLNRHEAWILEQIERADRLRRVRRTTQRKVGEILFRGEPTRVYVEMDNTHLRWNVVELNDRGIVLRRAAASQTPAARSLENWLRKQAREQIENQLAAISARLRQGPERVYLMGQRTKWGNCSPSRNLSFNWRLILAPDFVLRYLVAHETVHLAVPDHSAKFWLTVQSLCRETERAKQWLCANQAQMMVDLDRVLSSAKRAS